MRDVRVGTSGWSYPHWRGVFYPAGLAQRRWLEHYARHFRTVEINATFYRLPVETTVARWAIGVPPGFLFAVKVSRYLTHIRRLQVGAEGMARLMAACRPLGDKLGPLLVQLPPGFPPAPDLLAGFLSSCPRRVPVAVELRHAEWFVPEVRRVLEQRGAALVWSDLVDTPEWVTAPFLYVRRHGPGARYSGRYGRAVLRRLAERLRVFDGDVFCYFNNDAEGAAVADAAELVDLLG